MFKMIKRFKKRIVALSVSAIAVVSMAIVSSAAEPVVVTSDFITGIVTTAGESILTTIMAMVTAVVPILVGAAMAGFAIFGSKWIFNTIKGFLTKSAA